MSADDRVDFDTFLVEDVILTLCNVRLSLTWLTSDAAAAGSEDWRRVGIQRLDRELAQTEDRARALRDSLRERGGPASGTDPCTFRSRRTGSQASERRPHG